MAYGPQDCCGKCGHVVDDCTCYGKMAPDFKITVFNTRERVLMKLIEHASPVTATELARELNVSLSSLSSLLKKMYDAKQVRRVDDFGPRGGYGYETIYKHLRKR